MNSTPKMLFATALTLVALFPEAARAQAAPPVIHACLNPGNGNARIVELTAPCHPNEVRVQWNVIGPVGPAGPQGPIGPQGPAGTDGAIGPVGPIGPQGPAGNDGATGPIGPQGPSGVDGATGSVGPQGPAGNDGAIGPVGPIGPQGPAGNDGAIGPVGPLGPQGPAGNDGATGPIGPQGPVGPAGPGGPAGPTGSQGPTGLTGPQGPIGLTGPQGPIGLTGPQGPIGLTGPAGSDATLQPEVTRTSGRIGINNGSPSEALDVNGNIRSNGVVFYGNGGTRTETRNDADVAGGRSGFFETSAPINFYPNASSWQHLFEVRHSNPGVNFALQMGGGFFDQDLWYRKTNNSGGTGWLQLTGAGARNCTAPFNAISATSTTSLGGVTRSNTICGSAFFAAQSFQTAQEVCFAMGGHIPTYGEMFIIAKAHALPNGNVMLNGDWVGNRVDDDMVMVVNNQNLLTNFEGITNKNDNREFRCVQTSTVVQ